MKSPRLSLLIFLVSAAFATAQEQSNAPPVHSTSARILGNIPDGTPPPPQAPKPEYKVAPSDILHATTHEQGGRTITLQQIKPIALPPLPLPIAYPPSSPEQEAVFRARLAEYRATHPRNELLFLSATVFRSKDSLPHTLVRWWPQGKGETITFWSSADFALIAGGIQSFEDTAGDTHALLMGWGNVDIDRLAALSASKGRKYNAPEMPTFPEGKATFQILGNQPAAEDLVAIQSLHDLYNDEHARLLAAYQGRESARLQHEAYLKAHPPQPKDITLRYWRTESPAPTASPKGATR